MRTTLISMAAVVAVGMSLPSAQADPAPPSWTKVSQGKQIQVGKSPTAITTAGRFAYVAVSTDTVAVIDTRTDRVVRRYRNLPEPQAIVASPDGSKVYVSVTAAKGVREIDTASGKVRAIKSYGGTLLLSPDGRFLYASPGGAEMQRITLRTRRVRTIPGTREWVAEEVSANGRYLYVSWPRFDPVAEIPKPVMMKVRTTDWKVIRKRPIIEQSLWSFAGDMLLDPKDKFLYVSKEGDNNGITGYSGHTVQRYSARDLSPGRVYDVGSGDINVELGPQGLAFPRKHWRNRLAVANSNTGKVIVVDTATKSTIVRAAQFGPTAVAYNDTGRKLYVTNTGFGGVFPKTVTRFRFS